MSARRRVMPLGLGVLSLVLAAWLAPGVAWAQARAAAAPRPSDVLVSAAAEGGDASASSAAPALSPEAERFRADLTALLRSEHRLAGSKAGQEAADYLERRLRELGFPDVVGLDVPVFQSRTERCELTVEGTVVRLLPLRANVLVNPVTPAEGVTGPLFYVGGGSATDYGQRRPEGAIVVMDYDSEAAWERAFALGAAAVIFVGDGEESPVGPKHVGIPANELRFYAPRAALAGIDLEREHARATVVSRVVWEPRRGRDLIVRVRGTEPRFGAERVESEALVLAAAYDSFGVVPELSPGARGAANVAALLEAAAQFRRSPPRRDAWFVFLDGQARAHQGARELYASLAMTAEEVSAILQNLRDEQIHVTAMRDLLSVEGLTFDGRGATGVPGVDVAHWLALALKNEADFARDDVRRRLQLARLTKASVDAAALEELGALELRWDEIRRALHGGRLAALVAERGVAVAAGAGDFAALFGELQARTLRRFERRLAELGAEIHGAEQRARLRSGLGHEGEGGPPWVVLHATYDFGDHGRTWGVVVGDWTQRLFPWRQPKPEGDTPGYYGRVLNAFAAAVGEVSPERFDRRTLEEPSMGTSFAPGPFVNGGAIAGAYGYYNVALMTGHDGRPRDGHPADTLGRLDWRNLREQALEATRTLRRLADVEELSLPAVFTPTARSKLPRWTRGLAEGDYAGLVVTGSLAEDRPAAGAMMALWPGQSGWKQQAFTTLADANRLASFEPIAFTAVDTNGRFRAVGFREDMHQDLMTLGAQFDAQGAVVALSSTEQQVQRLAGAMRVNLIFGGGGRWTHLRAHDAPAESLRLLKASSDAPFRESRVLWGQLEGHGFFHVSDQVGAHRVKLFQPMGPVVLGAIGAGNEYGFGVAPDTFRGGLSLGDRTATDLYALNEKRLAILRHHGVTSADLERLHGRARRLREQGVVAGATALRQGMLARSAALSQRVYLPLRSAMDDLVHAVVVLLLLSIPFAFAMERLLLCASTIYGRITGFVVIFLLTFGLLYWLHPGFAIASTPIIIFLAFAIVLLSSLVIFIVVRKFKTELRAMQGQQASAHEEGVSQTATMLAAINMGMSTMRRRPTRTVLTAVTVVMLTFTILAFASFSRTVGVRSIYEGPPDEHTAPSLLLRRVDYTAMPPGVLDLLHGEAGEGGLIAPHYWLVRKEAQSPRLTVARTDDGRSLIIDAVLGVPAAQLARWPELAAALSARGLATIDEALGSGGVFVPPIVRDVLELGVGDVVLLGGRRVPIAGTLDGSALQRIRHLDQQSLLPVDFQDPTSVAFRPSAVEGSGDGDLLLTADVDRDFVHLSGDQVVVASAETVRAMGGGLHSIALHPGPGVDALARGRELAEVVVMPVWAAGPEGAERLVLTVLTEVTGGLALFVPLLLGGLIIFGTLLGSISDREREIYTFSALGLSPGHIGVLFFAEAAVYAIVGGVGGQLLAQLVGLVVTSLANAGRIPPVSINFSSSNSLFAIGVVMATVLVSAIYPAVRASRSANPGLARAWRMPAAEGDVLKLVFPFTVSAYDITGVVSFLAEHFRSHDDAGLGRFAASAVRLARSEAGHLELSAELALAPFDLGVTQRLRLTAVPSEIAGVDEVAIQVVRSSGAGADWYRANRVFMRDLRRQFLLWRTLSAEMIEQYRMTTLTALGEGEARREPPPAAGAVSTVDDEGRADG